MAKVALLSARAVQTLRKPGMYLDGRGLYLRIGPGGNKSWIYRFALGGKTRDMGLGPYPDIALAEARERAATQRKLRLDGTDPIAARQAGQQQAKLDAAKAMNFKACAEAYIAAHQAGWKNPKHAAQWPATLGAYVYPAFGALPVQVVDVGLVMKAIEPIWTEKPETASRVRGRIESVLDWATARGYRHGDNPARWRGHLENLLPKKTKVRRVEHHAALPYAEMAGFMAELREQEGIGARALEFAILTAARTGEVRGAKWDEIDLSTKLWTVPGERMKAGKEHRVPLSDATLTILEKMAAIRPRRFCLPRRQSRSSAQRHGAPDDDASDGSYRSDRARLPLDFLRLVCRADDDRERSSRNGPGAHRLRQGRSGISSWGFVREATAAGASMGRIL